MKYFVPAFVVVVTILLPFRARTQHSVARQWNEVLLEAVRKDNARPTVHARNLFHISAAMYDAWAAYEPTASPWLLGQMHRSYFTPFDGVPIPTDIKSAREEALSYAVYYLIKHRFANSPGTTEILQSANQKMEDLGYSPTVTSIDYSDGTPAHLGNYIAQSMINFGLQDGSNEVENYINSFYESVNPPLFPTNPGNPTIVDYNRWQPLALDVFIDQSGNVVAAGNLEFLSPEWGEVIPFSLNNQDLTIYERDENEYWVYHDPGPPPYLQEDGSAFSEAYKWGFSLVSIWASHLDPDDGVMWDISPASIGNIDEFPSDIEDFDTFYEQTDGGDIGTGHLTNPNTGLPYDTQMVPRGDYGRILAEFWADGPDSETPPGHWFTILNYVSDNPQLEKRYKGEGQILDDLEWDIKSYFILGGAVHDAAIAAWGIKGYYDYIRPISAIRAMAEQGQSSDPELPNYSPMGIPLVDGYIELVETDDPLAAPGDINVGKIKLYSWLGHESIEDPLVDYAGVGWILAEDWWPYQRPTFVTPPFAGYVSGHSTFSRAAAEVMTLLTGDPYFPGGMGEFNASRNEFLVFEEGPSMDVTLQWATYRDASDQCSLSRIWGGIHPPADDIPGRLIGEIIGVDAFTHAEKYFENQLTTINSDLDHNKIESLSIYPNPLGTNEIFSLSIDSSSGPARIELINNQGQEVWTTNSQKVSFRLPASILPGLYTIRHISANGTKTAKIVVK